MTITMTHTVIETLPGVELLEALRGLTAALGDMYDNGTYRHNPALDAAGFAARELIYRIDGQG